MHGRRHRRCLGLREVATGRAAMVSSVRCDGWSHTGMVAGGKQVESSSSRGSKQQSSRFATAGGSKRERQICSMWPLPKQAVSAATCHHPSSSCSSSSSSATAAAASAAAPKDLPKGSGDGMGCPNTDTAYGVAHGLMGSPASRAADTSPEKNWANDGSSFAAGSRPSSASIDGATATRNGSGSAVGTTSTQWPNTSRGSVFGEPFCDFGSSIRVVFQEFSAVASIDWSGSLPGARGRGRTGSALTPVIADMAAVKSSRQPMVRALLSMHQRKGATDNAGEKVATSLLRLWMRAARNLHDFGTSAAEIPGGHHEVRAALPLTFGFA